MRRSPRWMLLVTLALAAHTGAGARSPAQQEQFRDLAEQVRRALSEPGPGGVEALAGLRQLRDPTLRPLFAQLASTESGERQAQAILGMAELEDPPALDTFLLQQVKSPEEQARLLLAAREIGLLPAERLASVRDRPALHPEVEAAVAAITMSDGGDVPPEVGARLRASSGPPAVIGAIVGLQCGDPGAREALDPLLADATPEGRRSLMAALDAIGSARASAASAFVADALRTAADDPLVRARCVETLLRLGAEAAPGAWSEAYAAAGDLAQRIRLGLISLDHPVAIGRERLAALLEPEDSPALRPIGVAAAEASANTISIGALVSLVGTDQPACIAWALTRAAGMPPADAAKVRLAALERLREKPSPPLALREQATRAAADLLASTPDEFALVYSQAVWADRERETLALLLGALQTKDKPAASALGALEPSDPLTRGLAAMVAARAGAPLTKSLEEALVRAAEGAGGLTAVRRTQAAWLALRRLGQERSALAVVLTPGD